MIRKRRKTNKTSGKVTMTTGANSNSPSANERLWNHKNGDGEAGEKAAHELAIIRISACASKFNGKNSKQQRFKFHIPKTGHFGQFLCSGYENRKFRTFSVSISL